MNPNLLNGSNLAYIGDAYFELFVREYLIRQGISNSNNLQKEAKKYVTASAHAEFIDQLLPKLAEEEISIYKRGRNAPYKSHRKNLDLANHQKSTGFEALIGYLYLNGNFERLNNILECVTSIINSSKEV